MQSSQVVRVMATHDNPAPSRVATCLFIFLKVYMQFLGKRVGPTKCYCSYCVGKNDSKACHRTLKKRGRQHAKKELKKDLKAKDDQSNS